MIFAVRVLMALRNLALGRRRLLLSLLLGILVLYSLSMITLHKEIGAFSLVRYRNRSRPPKDYEIPARHRSESTREDRNVEPGRLGREEPFTNLDFVPRRSHTAGLGALSLGNVPPLFKQWQDGAEELCGKNIVAYGGAFARLKNVLVVPPAGCSGSKKNATLPEGDWPAPCFSAIECNTALKPYAFNDSSHLNDWMSIMNSAPQSLLTASVADPHLNIVVARHAEVNNFYHVLTDVYNAFLVMIMFNRSQADTAVLIADQHPPGDFEQMWVALFDSAAGLYARSQEGKFYDEMIWSIPARRSPLNEHYATSDFLIEELNLVFNSVMFVPYLELFRQFVLDTFLVDHKRSIDCNHLSIVYIENSRPPSTHNASSSSFKHCTVKNAEELLEMIREEYPAHTVRVLATDRVPLRKQLGIIGAADVLIGVHSPWMAHSLFLSGGAGLVELVPSHLNAWEAVHFQACAEWRRLAYRRWDNWNPKHEFPGHVTYVPPDALREQLDSVIDDMCYKKKR